MIPKNDFVPYAVDNGSVRINHDSDGCSGSSKSMQITSYDDGSIVAYCHRCGDKGVYKNEFFRPITKRKAVLKNKTLALPSDIETEPSKWEPNARVWLYKARLTDTMITKYGIVYSSSLRRVILPTYHDGKLSSYQARKIYDKDEGPKYYTRYTGAPRYAFYYNKPDTEIVIVEDMISAIRIYELGYSVLALMGTLLYNSVLTLLLDNHINKYKIWLDNDNANVTKNRRVLRNKLELFGKVTTIFITNDPKNLSDEEITDALSV